MVAKTAADATDADTAVTDQRYAILKKAKIGSYVTLTMKALTSATSGAGGVGARLHPHSISFRLDLDLAQAVCALAVATAASVQPSCRDTCCACASHPPELRSPSPPTMGRR